MSKPPFASLGITAELTLHERALREAQNEISALKAENARLREELRRERALPGLGDEFRPNPLLAQSMNDPPILRDTIARPPHYSTVGLDIDGEGRVSG